MRVAHSEDVLSAQLAQTSLQNYAAQEELLASLSQCIPVQHRPQHSYAAERPAATPAAATPAAAGSGISFAHTLVVFLQRHMHALNVQLTCSANAASPERCQVMSHAAAALVQLAATSEPVVGWMHIMPDTAYLASQLAALPVSAPGCAGLARTGADLLQFCRACHDAPADWQPSSFLEVENDPPQQGDHQRMVRSQAERDGAAALSITRPHSSAGVSTAGVSTASEASLPGQPGPDRPSAGVSITASDASSTAQPALDKPSATNLGAPAPMVQIPQLPSALPPPRPSFTPYNPPYHSQPQQPFAIAANPWQQQQQQQQCASVFPAWDSSSAAPPAASTLASTLAPSLPTFAATLRDARSRAPPAALPCALPLSSAGPQCNRSAVHSHQGTRAPDVRGCMRCGRYIRSNQNPNQNRTQLCIACLAAAQAKQQDGAGAGVRDQAVPAQCGTSSRRPMHPSQSFVRSSGGYVWGGDRAMGGIGAGSTQQHYVQPALWPGDTRIEPQASLEAANSHTQIAYAPAQSFQRIPLPAQPMGVQAWAAPAATREPVSGGNGYWPTQQTAQHLQQDWQQQVEQQQQTWQPVRVEQQQQQTWQPVGVEQQQPWQPVEVEQQQQQTWQPVGVEQQQQQPWQPVEVEQQQQQQTWQPVGVEQQQQQPWQPVEVERQQQQTWQPVDAAIHEPPVPLPTDDGQRATAEQGEVAIIGTSAAAASGPWLHAVDSCDRIFTAESGTRGSVYSVQHDPAQRHTSASSERNFTAESGTRGSVHYVQHDPVQRDDSASSTAIDAQAPCAPEQVLSALEQAPCALAGPAPAQYSQSEVPTSRPGATEACSQSGPARESSVCAQAEANTTRNPVTQLQMVYNSADAEWQVAGYRSDCSAFQQAVSDHLARLFAAPATAAPALPELHPDEQQSMEARANAAQSASQGAAAATHLDPPALRHHSNAPVHSVIHTRLGPPASQEPPQNSPQKSLDYRPYIIPIAPHVDPPSGLPRPSLCAHLSDTVPPAHVLVTEAQLPHLRQGKGLTSQGEGLTIQGKGLIDHNLKLSSMPQPLQPSSSAADALSSHQPAAHGLPSDPNLAENVANRSLFAPSEDCNPDPPPVCAYAAHGLASKRTRPWDTLQAPSCATHDATRAPAYLPAHSFNDLRGRNLDCASHMLRDANDARSRNRDCASHMLRAPGAAWQPPHTAQPFPRSAALSVSPSRVSADSSPLHRYSLALQFGRQRSPNKRQLSPDKRQYHSPDKRQYHCPDKRQYYPESVRHARSRSPGPCCCHTTSVAYPSERAASVRASPVRSYPSRRAASVNASPVRAYRSQRAASASGSPASAYPSQPSSRVLASPAGAYPSERAASASASASSEAARVHMLRLHSRLLSPDGARDNSQPSLGTESRQHSSGGVSEWLRALGEQHSAHASPRSSTLLTQHNTFPGFPVAAAKLVAPRLPSLSSVGSSAATAASAQPSVAETERQSHRVERQSSGKARSPSQTASAAQPAQLDRSPTGSAEFAGRVRAIGEDSDAMTPQGGVLRHQSSALSTPRSSTGRPLSQSGTVSAADAPAEGGVFHHQRSSLSTPQSSTDRPLSRSSTVRPLSRSSTVGAADALELIPSFSPQTSPSRSASSRGASRSDAPASCLTSQSSLGSVLAGGAADLWHYDELESALRSVSATVSCRSPRTQPAAPLPTSGSTTPLASTTMLAQLSAASSERFDGGRFGSRRFDSGRFDSGRIDRVAADDEAQQTHRRSGKERARRSGRSDSGRFDSGRFDSGRFDRVAADDEAQQMHRRLGKESALRSGRAASGRFERVAVDAAQPAHGRLCREKAVRSGHVERAAADAAQPARERRVSCSVSHGVRSQAHYLHRRSAGPWGRDDCGGSDSESLRGPCMTGPGLADLHGCSGQRSSSRCVSGEGCVSGERNTRCAERRLMAAEAASRPCARAPGNPVIRPALPRGSPDAQLSCAGLRGRHMLEASAVIRKQPRADWKSADRHAKDAAKSSSGKARGVLQALSADLQAVPHTKTSLLRMCQSQLQRSAKREADCNMLIAALTGI